jgi:hypothetical protein
MADDLERLAVRHCPFHRPFDVVGVARSQSVGHGVSSIWRVIACRDRRPISVIMR